VDATWADTTAGVAALGVTFLIFLTTSVKLKIELLENLLLLLPLWAAFLAPPFFAAACALAILELFFIKKFSFLFYFQFS
jgi:hypothetical protein